MKLQKEYSKLAKILEDAYKKEIKKEKLVDTGDLLKTFKVEVDLSGKKAFKIIANDYFVYLDAEYDITNKVLKSSSYRLFEKGLEELYFKILTD